MKERCVTNWEMQYEAESKSHDADDSYNAEGDDADDAADAARGTSASRSQLSRFEYNHVEISYILHHIVLSCNYGVRHCGLFLLLLFLLFLLYCLLHQKVRLWARKQDAATEAAPLNWMHIIRSGCSVFASPLLSALLRLSFLLQHFSAAALHPWSRAQN